VLVVEDDRTARRAIASILKRQGFAVSEAGTLAEATRALRDPALLAPSDDGPAWILLDLMLPDGNGADLLRRMRRDPSADAGHCKVCVITGCGAAAVNEVRALSPDHIFTKPLNVEGLLAVMGDEDSPRVRAAAAV
jgi:DNA-binding response OmpR family regulator